MQHTTYETTGLVPTIREKVALGLSAIGMLFAMAAIKVHPLPAKELLLRLTDRAAYHKYSNIPDEFYDE